MENHDKVIRSRLRRLIKCLQESSLEHSPVHFFKVKIPLAGNHHSDQLNSDLLSLAAISFKGALYHLKNKAQKLIKCLLQALMEKLLAGLLSLLPQSLKDEILV